MLLPVVVVGLLDVGFGGAAVLQYGGVRCGWNDVSLHQLWVCILTGLRCDVLCVQSVVRVRWTRVLIQLARAYGLGSKVCGIVASC